MALMKYREGNRVKWQGSRPAHNGEQVLEQASVNNATGILYTVPVGKILYLVHWWHGFYVGGVNGDSNMAIYDEVPALYRWISYLTGIAGQSLNFSSSPFIPIEVPADYSIRATNAAATHWTRCGIFGWVE